MEIIGVQSGKLPNTGASVSIFPHLGVSSIWKVRAAAEGLSLMISWSPDPAHIPEAVGGVDQVPWWGSWKVTSGKWKMSLLLPTFQENGTGENSVWGT